MTLFNASRVADNASRTHLRGQLLREDLRVCEARRRGTSRLISRYDRLHAHGVSSGLDPMRRRSGVSPTERGRIPRCFRWYGGHNRQRDSISNKFERQQPAAASLDAQGPPGQAQSDQGWGQAFHAGCSATLSLSVSSLVPPSSNASGLTVVSITTCVLRTASECRPRAQSADHAAADGISPPSRRTCPG